MSRAGQPGQRLDIYNGQQVLELDIERLGDVATRALAHCLRLAREAGDVLSALVEIEVSIVDDATIGEVHREFLDDPSPTDVITFDHGEILISAETAAARAAEFGNPPDREVALYLIHGLLHLAGYRDKTEAEFEQMREAQESVLQSVW